MEFFFLEAAEALTSLALVVSLTFFIPPKRSLAAVASYFDALGAVVFLGDAPAAPYFAVLGFLDPGRDCFFTVGDISLFLDPAATES